MLTKRITLSGVIIHIIFIMMSLMCILPVLLIIGTSLSSETSIIENGYSIIPQEVSSQAYKYLFENRSTILHAYGLTIITTVAGTILSVIVIAMYAYPISRSDFKYRKPFTMFMFIIMLFHGGTVPWYMVCTQILHIQNTIWALILPYVVNVWYLMIMKTFFKTTIPPGLIEAAKIDGAGEFRIFFTLIIPISLPAFATVGLFMTLLYWNDWWLPIMLTSKPELMNLQFLLQNFITNIQMANENSALIGTQLSMQSIPVESTRMAMCVIAIGPIVMAYPFFQKYFVSGLTVGSIKE